MILTLPPLIDCHVHFREPGMEAKADMASEGDAAFHGGVRVVCDMPNTKPPTQSVQALQDKVRLAETHGDPSKCRMFFFFGATADAHLAELERLWTDPALADLKAHCCGLKLYLDNSTGDLKSSAEVTRAAFALCGRLGIVLVAHCEQSQINDAAAEQHPYSGAPSHSLRRPAESEVTSVGEAIALAVENNTALHIAHLSTAGGVAAIKAARKAHPSLRLTCEVTPHHLFLTTEDYPCCGTRIKVNPPVRAPEHSEALWAALLAGDIDCVGTDHAPHLLSEKADSTNPPSGMPGVELVVPLLLTVAAGRWPHAHAPRPQALSASTTDAPSLTPNDIERLMFTNPKRIFGLPVERGEASGFVSRFDTTKEWTVVETELHSKCKWSPYNGWTLIGKAVVPSPSL